MISIPFTTQRNPDNRIYSVMIRTVGREASADYTTLAEWENWVASQPESPAAWAECH